MSSEESRLSSAGVPAGGEGPIGVGAVGVWPGQYDGILAALPQGAQFRLVAFSDEGLPSVDADAGGYGLGEADLLQGEASVELVPIAQSQGEAPICCHPDYNVMLQDPAVGLVLVDGAVELRRDFAVRALNAGRHVVVAPPFCETALDAERVAKTAMRSGLVATMDLPYRDDPDLVAVQAALQAEGGGAVRGVFLFVGAGDLPGPASSGGRRGLMQEVGLAALDQMRLVLDEDVKSVSAHLHRLGPRDPDDGFLLYLPLRKGGWAICQASRHQRVGLPRWVVYAGRTAITANAGRAVAVTTGEQRTYGAQGERVGFWQNVYAAVRQGDELRFHPAGIVRAMKLHEAAMRSAELGEPVTI